MKKNPLFYDIYPYIPITSLEGELDKIPTSFDSKTYYEHHTPSRSMSSLVDDNRMRTSNRSQHATQSLPTLPSVADVSSSRCSSFTEVDPLLFSSALPRKEFLIGTVDNDNDTEDTEEDFDSDESDSEELENFSNSTGTEKGESPEKESG